MKRIAYAFGLVIGMGAAFILSDGVAIIRAIM